MNIEVVERRDAPGVWSVEIIDHASDGEVMVTLFHGPWSRQRAVEYAKMQKRISMEFKAAVGMMSTLDESLEASDGHT